MTGTALESRAGDSSTKDQRPFPTLIVVLALIIGIGVGYGAYSAENKVQVSYRSAAAISLDQPLLLAQSTNPGVIQKLSQLRAVYIGLASTDDVLDPVAGELGLTRGVVASSVFATVPTNSLLMVAGAQGSNRAQTQRIATAFVSELQQFIAAQQSRNKIPPKLRVQAKIVIAPRGAFPVLASSRKRITISVVAGLLAAILVVGAGIPIRRRFR
jgi:capsular polysaccharide biosynthesis protein